MITTSTYFHKNEDNVALVVCVNMCSEAMLRLNLYFTSNLSH